MNKAFKTKLTKSQILEYLQMRHDKAWDNYELFKDGKSESSRDVAKMFQVQWYETRRIIDDLKHSIRMSYKVK